MDKHLKDISNDLVLSHIQEKLIEFTNNCQVFLQKKINRFEETKEDGDFSIEQRIKEMIATFFTKT